MSRSVIIQFRCPLDKHDELLAIAKETGITVSEFCRTGAIELARLTREKKVLEAETLKVTV